MLNSRFTILVSILMALALSGCAAGVHGQHERGSDVALECTSCARGEAGQTVWCDHCLHGFVDSKKIQCKKCYESIAEDKGPCVDCRQGQQGEGTECTSCARGKSGDTEWCEHCARGFVEGESVGCKDCYTQKIQGNDSCDRCTKK